MVYFYASGRISVYLAPEFRIYSLVAGLGLCVLGIFNLLTMKADVGCGHDHDHGDEGQGHEHDHDHGPPITVVSLIFLTVPLLVAARISPDGFGAQTVANKGLYNPNYEANPVKEGFDLRVEETAPRKETAGPAVEPQPQPETATATEPEPEPADDGYGEYTLADLEAQVDKSAEGNYLLTIPQLFYTGGDEELQRVLKGLPVETVGQVMDEEINNADGTRLRIFRLFIECCAADARPLSIPAEFGKAAPEYQEMGWVKIIGTMNYVSEDGMTVPVLEVKTMEPTEPPEDEMIF